MALFSSKKSSTIRSKVMEAVDKKIAEAESRYTEKCTLADTEYATQIQRAAEVRDQTKDVAEQEAVDSVVGKLFN